jgi:hypothetical protein
MIAKENTHKRWTNHSGKADSLACRAGREGGVVQLLHLTPEFSDLGLMLTSREEVGS